jgi:hypothetical protein
MPSESLALVGLRWACADLCLPLLALVDWWWLALACVDLQGLPVLAFVGPALGCGGLCWPLLGCVDFHWAVVAFVGLRGSSLVVVVETGMAWWVVASKYKKKDKINILNTHLAINGPLLACVGLCWPSLGCVGLHWVTLAFVGPCWPSLAFVGLCWAVLVFVGLHWPSLGLRWPYVVQ